MIVPSYVTDLQTAYGPPSQAGFGSAVFHEVLAPRDDLEAAAQAKYKYFLADKWSEAYRAGWKLIYERPQGSAGDIVAELRSTGDAGATSSASMILDVIADGESARQTLSVAYDDPATTELTIHTIGDGEAMSGLVISGRRAAGESTFIVFLMD